MKGYSLLTIGALVVGIAIALSGVLAQDSSKPSKQQKVDKTDFENQFPVTDNNKPEPIDPEERSKRRAKGKKYDYGGIPITENNEFIAVTSEWDIGLDALPVKMSDVVVTGEVTDAQTFISNDKTGVYTEFTIRVDEVLKNTSTLAVTQGGLVIADRQGGRIRFPSGHITLQYVRGQGMLRVGRRYTIFLNYDDKGQNTHVITGYELSGGRVFPVDNPAGGQHPIATTYKGVDESSFLTDLRAAIANIK